jgi:hypothetical protein
MNDRTNDHVSINRKIEEGCRPSNVFYFTARTSEAARLAVGLLLTAVWPEPEPAAA